MIKVNCSIFARDFDECMYWYKNHLVDKCDTIDDILYHTVNIQMCKGLLTVACSCGEVVTKSEWCK